MMVRISCVLATIVKNILMSMLGRDGHVHEGQQRGALLTAFVLTVQ